VKHLIGQLLDEDQWWKGVRLRVTDPVEVSSSSTGSALYSNQKR
jgi:hypothetical protein